MNSDNPSDGKKGVIDRLNENISEDSIFEDGMPKDGISEDSISDDSISEESDNDNSDRTKNDSTEMHRDNELFDTDSSDEYIQPYFVSKDIATRIATKESTKSKKMDMDNVEEIIDKGHKKRSKKKRNYGMKKKDYNSESTLLEEIKKLGIEYLNDKDAQNQIKMDVNLPDDYSKRFNQGLKNSKGIVEKQAKKLLKSLVEYSDEKKTDIEKEVNFIYDFGVLLKNINDYKQSNICELTNRIRVDVFRSINKWHTSDDYAKTLISYGYIIPNEIEYVSYDKIGEENLSEEEFANIRKKEVLLYTIFKYSVTFPKECGISLSTSPYRKDYCAIAFLYEGYHIVLLNNASKPMKKYSGEIKPLENMKDMFTHELWENAESYIEKKVYKFCCVDDSDGNYNISVFEKENDSKVTTKEKTRKDSSSEKKKRSRKKKSTVKSMDLLKMFSSSKAKENSKEKLENNIIEIEDNEEQPDEKTDEQVDDQIKKSDYTIKEGPLGKNAIEVRRKTAPKLERDNSVITSSNRLQVYDDDDTDGENVQNMIEMYMIVRELATEKAKRVKCYVKYRSYGIDIYIAKNSTPSRITRKKIVFLLLDRKLMRKVSLYKKNYEN